MKECSHCALCCKLLDVPGLAPQGKWSRHCDPGNPNGCCKINDSRPEVCLGFDCFWRAESWPDELRPDRCHVIFEALPGVKTILISIDSSYPDAWKDKKILVVIEKLCKKGRPIVLKTKDGSQMFIPVGWTKEDILKEIKFVIDWKEKMYGSSNIYN